MSSGDIPRRPFGRHAETGVGARARRLPPRQDRRPEREATAVVHAAIDGGITFMDNAWEYNEGVSEIRMGKAIKDRRDRVFLMTKVCTHGRDARLAMRQLEESLRRLQTDHLDLWQIHECVYYNEPEQHFAAGGVIEALDEARAAGQGALRRLHRPQGSRRSTCGCSRTTIRSTACQLPLNGFDATLPQLRAAGAAGAGSPRHRADRHEEPRRGRQGR